MADKFGGFPSIPTTKEDYYLVDSGDLKRTDKNRIKFPEENKKVVFSHIAKQLEVEGKIPLPVKGVPKDRYFSSGGWDFILGIMIKRGRSAFAFIDDEDHTFSKLWETNPSEEWARQNVHQKELYKRLAVKYPLFTYRGEFPGGQSQKQLDNQGNLQEWLYERLEYVGYLSTQNLLIAPDGRIIIPDFAGNPSIFSLSDYLDPKALDPTAPQCMENELKYFESALRKIMATEEPATQALLTL